jgi:hypothetical protein
VGRLHPKKPIRCTHSHAQTQTQTRLGIILFDHDPQGEGYIQKKRTLSRARPSFPRKLENKFSVFPEMKNHLSVVFSDGGERGIRTPGPLTRSTVFETAPFDRSGISPNEFGFGSGFECGSGMGSITLTPKLKLTPVRGERGIRTPGGLHLNGFQDRRNRPLCHLSAAKVQRFPDIKKGTGDWIYDYCDLRLTIIFQSKIVNPVNRK